MNARFCSFTSRQRISAEPKLLYTSNACFGLSSFPSFAISPSFAKLHGAHKRIKSRKIAHIANINRGSRFDPGGCWCRNENWQMCLSLHRPGQSVVCWTRWTRWYHAGRKVYVDEISAGETSGWPQGLTFDSKLLAQRSHGQRERKFA